MDVSAQMKKIQNKLNIKVKGILGKGLYGTVYDIGGGQVLKATIDPEEAYAAKKLLEKDLKNVYRVFNVFTIKKNVKPKKYFIVTERLQELHSNDHFPALYEFLRRWNTMSRVDQTEEILKKCDNREECEKLIASYSSIEKGLLSCTFTLGYWKDVALELHKFDKMLRNNKKQVEDLSHGILELKNLGINNFNDIWYGNVMKRGDTFVFIDVKDEKSQMINILENKRAILTEKSIYFATTEKQKQRGLKNIALEDWSGMMVFKDVKEGDTFVGEDCLFDIRIAFLDISNKVLSTGIIKKDTGMVVAPKNTNKAVETAASDDYKFDIGHAFPIPARKIQNPYVSIVKIQRTQ